MSPLDNQRPGHAAHEFAVSAADAAAHAEQLRLQIRRLTEQYRQTIEKARCHRVMADIHQRLESIR